jgi:rare lipoprotein A
VSSQQGTKASFYHDNFHGRLTSNGERYDKTDFTAAHKTLPFNTIVLVTNRNNKKSVVVRINDRGPFVKSRVIDLSRVAAMQLGMVRFGVVPVQVTRLGLLDQLPKSDSLLKPGDCWDAYGQKTTLQDSSIFLWSTDQWKHAFYMVSDMELKDPDHEYVIQVAETEEGRCYHLVVTGLQSTERLETFIQSGFVKAAVVNNP